MDPELEQANQIEEESEAQPETVKENARRSPVKLLKEGVLYFFQVLILTLIIINFIGRVSVVQGSSMVPQLHTNNRVLLNLFVYRFKQPQRGEIIVFQCPVNPEKDYIKRVIGLPGETIEIKHGKVFINDREINEPYLEYIDRFEDLERTTIPRHSFFVMGDNRLNSEDSRVWGPLDSKLVKGKAQLIFWPPKSFKVLK